MFTLPQSLTLCPAFLQVHVSTAIEAANMGMIQKKNSEDFFMMVLPETRGTHRMPVPESEVSLFWNVDSVLPNRGWNGHSQWPSRRLVHLTFHSHTTLPSPLMCFLPDWQWWQPTSQAYTLWPWYKKLGPCPQRNRWPRGSPSTNTDNNQYPRAPDYSNSTSSAVDRLHGWDLLLLFRLDTHIFMCPLYFIAGKNHQWHPLSGIPRNRSGLISLPWRTRQSAADTLKNGPSLI